MGFPTGFQSWPIGVLKEIKEILGTTGTLVKPNGLKVLNRTKYDVDNSSVTILDASTKAGMVAVSVCNAGDEDIYLDINATPTSTSYIVKLASGETWEYPLISTTDGTNDLNAIRASAQANDDIIVIAWEEG